MSLLSRARDFLLLRDLPANRPLPTVAPAETHASAAGLIAPFAVGKPTWPLRDVRTYEDDGYAKLALMFACVGLIADAFAAVPLRVYQEGADGNQTTLPNHPLRLLMRRPNPEQWEGEFAGQVATTALVTGTCVMQKVRSDAGRVVELWPLDTARLKAVARNQAPFDWEYALPGVREPARLKAADVVVFRWRNRVGRSAFGIGPPEVLFREIGLVNVMQDFLKAFFDAGALSQQIVVVDTMPGQTLRQDQKDALEDQFLRRHGGLRQAWRPIFTGGIKDIKDVGMDFNELAWDSLRDLNDLAICQAFGVPASMAQIRAGLEHSDSRANAQVDEQKLYRQTVLPQLSRLDGTFTLGLLSEFEPVGSPRQLEFDTSDVQALQEDRNARAAVLNPVFLGGGIPASVWAAELRLPKPLEDFYLTPLSTERVPAADVLKPPEPVPTPLRPGGGQEPPDGDEGDDDATEGLSRLLGDGATRAIAAGRGPAGRLAIGASNRKLIQRIAEARQPSIRTFFQGQGRRVVAALRAPVGIAGLAGANGHARETLALADVPWDEEDRLLETVLNRLYLLSGSTAFAAVADQLGAQGLDWSLANPNVRAVMDRLGTRVVGINQATRDDIARVVTAGLEEGVTLEELSNRLTGLFDETYKGRSLTIARTESMVSYGEASILGYRESGVVDRVQMLDSATHCEPYGASDGLSCCERDGLVVPLDQAQTHLYAEHPNGSLTFSPVLTGED